LFVLLGFLGLSVMASWAVEPDSQVLIVVGPSNHAPGTHEVGAGGRLIAHCLESMETLPGFKAEVRLEWPVGQAILDTASTVVFIGDTFPPMRLPDSAAILKKLGEMMARGCGIVCVHYATGLRADDVRADGDHPLLQWMGGYFATKCLHHQSIARIFPAATIAPAAPDHPIWRGCQAFTIHDEPYINNYFGPYGNRMAANVTALATAMLPPEAPKAETVSWCVERQDGGRGFAVVMPHFYRNWKNDELRRFIMNGIVWTAKLEVPEAGVKTAVPDLSAFAPAALEPAAPKPKPVSAAK